MEPSLPLETGTVELVNAAPVASPEAFFAQNVETTSAALNAPATGPLLAQSVGIAVGVGFFVWGIRSVMAEIGLVPKQTTSRSA